jgi:hypothetical protein
MRSALIYIGFGRWQKRVHLQVQGVVMYQESDMS